VFWKPVTRSEILTPLINLTISSRVDMALSEAMVWGKTSGAEGASSSTTAGAATGATIGAATGAAGCDADREFTDDLGVLVY
jgi:hypothetical protein